MSRRIRAAWMAFCRPELVEESPEETAQVLVTLRRETEQRMCREFAEFLRGELTFWHERAAK